MDSESNSIQPMAGYPVQDDGSTPVKERSWGAILGWILIPAGILALAIAAVVWASGEEARQIRAWGQKGDTTSLIHFLEGTRTDAGPNSTSPESQNLAWSELMRITPEAKSIDLEALFYALGANHPLGPLVLSQIGSTHRVIRDVPRFAEAWLALPDPNSAQAKAMASIIQSGGANTWGAPLRAFVGRAYGEGNLATSIGRAERLSALGLDPVDLQLKEALEQAHTLQSGIYENQASISDLDSKTSEVEGALSRMDWPNLTAFLVDRVPGIGDNAYEIATFHWNGWEMERDETAILTCSETTFNTKGRFTMAVHPTGIKTFSLQNGRSVSLPTFSEVTRRERSEQLEAKLRFGDLKSRRRQAQESIRIAEGQLENLNHRIKQLLGWELPPAQA